MKARRKPSHKLAFFLPFSLCFLEYLSTSELAEENLVVEEEDGKVFE